MQKVLRRFVTNKRKSSPLFSRYNNLVEVMETSERQTRLPSTNDLLKISFVPIVNTNCVGGANVNSDWKQWNHSLWEGNSVRCIKRVMNWQSCSSKKDLNFCVVGVYSSN